MTFSTNLKHLRKKRRLSQDYIAELLGYKSFTTIQKWESGIAEPSVDKLRILADFFNVSMDELLNDDLTTPIIHPEFGDHQQNLDYLEKNPNLLELYKNIYESDNLRLLFDKAQQLEPNDMEMVLKIIDQFIKEVDSE